MRKDDLATVRFMIELYCRGRHKTEKGKLCKDCQELWEYVQFRRSKCPFGDDKPFCSNCRIHCYKPEMREKIKEVMRYSGPRMIFYDPLVAFAHLRETLQRKSREKKTANGKNETKGKTNATGKTEKGENAK